MASEIALDHITITALYWESIKSFNRLLDFLGSSKDAASTLPDDFGRLKVWAENVAAHRNGTLSLDHHLREALSVKESVKDLLMDLNTVLEESEYYPSYLKSDIEIKIWC
jgi:hypothetical protein